MKLNPCPLCGKIPRVTNGSDLGYEGFKKVTHLCHGFIYITSRQYSRREENKAILDWNRFCDLVNDLVKEK